MSGRCVAALVVCGLSALVSPPGARAHPLPANYDNSLSDSGSGWDALGELYALLARHDALGGHVLARKSVRSPSRRLRFGRSDPDMPPHAPLEEMDELLSQRDVRSPVRLRFGRRSEEEAVPHIFPQENQDRVVGNPTLRLRYGRQADNNMFLMPFEPAAVKEVKTAASLEGDRQAD